MTADDRFVAVASSDPAPLLDREAVARLVFNHGDNPDLWDHPWSILTRDRAYEVADAILSLSTKPLVGGGVQPSIGTKQSTDPEVSSRTETASAIHSALSKASIEYSALSVSGFNLYGDSKSISAARSWLHSHGQIDDLKTNLRHWRDECGKLHARSDKAASVASDVTDAMVDRALDAWFASPPSETDQGLARSMRAALEAAQLSKTSSVDHDASNLSILAEQSPSPSSTSATATETDGGDV